MAAYNPDEWAPDMDLSLSESPRYHRFVGHRQKGPGFPIAKRAVFLSALAVNGRIKLAAAVAGIDPRTVSTWRTKGKKQLAAIEKAADAGTEYKGETEHSDFYLASLGAAGFWEASAQSIVQQAAESGNVGAAQWLLGRYDRLQGRNGSVVPETGEATDNRSVMSKLDQMIERRTNLAKK